jgi:hypothetical protein
MIIENPQSKYGIDIGWLSIAYIIFRRIKQVPVGVGTPFIMPENLLFDNLFKKGGPDPSYRFKVCLTYPTLSDFQRFSGVLTVFLTPPSFGQNCVIFCWDILKMPYGKSSILHFNPWLWKKSKNLFQKYGKIIFFVEAPFSEKKNIINIVKITWIDAGFNMWKKTEIKWPAIPSKL